MAGTVLAIEATDQAAFATAWPFRNAVNATLIDNGFTPIVKSGPNACQGAVQQVAADPNSNIALIVGVGHGTFNSFLGFDRQPVFQTKIYDPMEVENKIVHLTACDTGDQLGPDFVTNGCIAFIGYNTLVSWNDDTTAASWFECDAAIDTALANGATVAEAYAAGMQKFCDMIDQLRNSNNGVGADFLQNISKCLCSPVTDRKYGDGSAKLR